MAGTNLIIGVFFHSTIDALLIQSIAESCYRITPQVFVQSRSLTSSSSVFHSSRPFILLDVTQSLHLFSQQRILLTLKVILNRYQVSAELISATDVFRCRAKSSFLEFHHSTEESLAHLPIDAAFCFVDPFRALLDEEKKQIQFLIQQMKAMGVVHFDFFLQIPLQSIGSRFGKIGVTVYEHASRMKNVPWPPFLVQEQIEEFIQLDHELQIQSLEPLLFILKNRLDFICLRLKARSLRLNRLWIQLNLQSQDPPYSIDLKLPMAQGSTLGILPILREMLSRGLEQTPLSSEVSSVWVRVLDTSPGHSVQKNFFHSDETLAEAHDQLLSRLISHLGVENVFYAKPAASYCPEKAWSKTLCLKTNHSRSHDSRSHFLTEQDKNLKKEKKVLESPPESTHLTLKRPTRILKEPQWIEFESFQLLRSQERDWKILYWIGPERLKAEWWVTSPAIDDSTPAPHPINRDYYQVMTDANEKLWVYFDRNVQPPQLFLHGYFD